MKTEEKLWPKWDFTAARRARPAHRKESGGDEEGAALYAQFHAAHTRAGLVALRQLRAALRRGHVHTRVYRLGGDVLPDNGPLDAAFFISKNLNIKHFNNNCN